MFDLYLKELLEWNNKFNLTSITDPAEVRLKHFEDSLALLQVMELTNESVIDIGAGAGFPGIPLKLKCPNIKLTLVEATGKKVEFLRHLVATLKIEGVKVFHARAEELAKTQKEVYDLAVSRAVAQLNVLAEYCLPFVKIGGLFVAYKDAEVEEEVAQAQKAIAALGGKIKEIKKIKIPGWEIGRSLVIIEKISPTPAKYPRRPGMARKKPLQ
jgi:16S rRNA (guanine527-N7)-methyltransferase